MEWYEVTEVIQTVAIIVIMVSLFIILFEGTFDGSAKKPTEEANKEKEKTKDNTKLTEPKQTTKVVVFDSQRNLSLWFDAIRIKLFQLGLPSSEVTYGARTIKLADTTIIFIPRVVVNETWFTFPKDTLYYLTAEYDLNDNFNDSFYTILFTQSGYLTVDEMRRVLHL